MSVGTKLLALMLLAALVPLAISTTTAVRVHQRAFDAKIGEIHRMAAENGAREVRASLDGAQRQLGALARTIPWNQLTPEERTGALWLLYEQLDDVVAVTLVDERGDGIGPSAYRVERDARGHLPVTTGDLERFGRGIPLEAALRDGFALAEPVHLQPASAPIVTLAFQIAGPAPQRWVVAVGLSMRGLCSALLASRGADMWLTVIAADGQLLCPGSAPAAGTALVSTSAEAPMRWKVVADTPRAAALAPSDRMRRQTLLWVAVGVAAALGAGLVLSRGVRRRLAELTAGAEALAAGRLDHRVPVSSRDELGTLAASFNRMSGEISRQDAEIRSWNEELRVRVEARTRELATAQAELTEARKLAGLATLGAGFAHEVNNPLSGVLGLTQVLIAKAAEGTKEHRMLTSIERESMRIREIVQRMSALAAEGPGRGSVSTRAVLDSVAASLAPRLAAAKVDLERGDTTDLPSVLGDAEQLEHALREIADNGIRAMEPAGGTLVIRSRNEASKVAIEIVDTGRGIAPEIVDRIFEPFYTTKQDWRSHGLGLAVAQRIIAAHGGSIRVASALGKGTTMTVTLPQATTETHLV